MPMKLSAPPLMMPSLPKTSVPGPFLTISESSVRPAHDRTRSIVSDAAGSATSKTAVLPAPKVKQRSIETDGPV
ncbi:MAG: hypothetical protein BWX70_03043 [Verrucomicrobia bacterium ADurb.Bin070]|nr:MAG: hypothetical protein BWX70_03043 [Verrucomicrobia bacterium ADurb.Bin070]